MKSIDPKKIENKDERANIAKDIFNIRNLNIISEDVKQRLIRDLLDQKKITETERPSVETPENLELEPDNLHIDSTGREETEINLYDGGIKKMKINSPKCDIIEYIDGPQKGEQLFLTYKSFVLAACKIKKCSRSVLETRYLPTKEKLMSLAGNPGEKNEQYIKFSDGNIKESQFAGYFIPHGNKLGKIGKRYFIRMAGGDNAKFGEEDREINEGGKNYGFSGRLFK